jgi:hypothetical protein
MSKKRPFGERPLLQRVLIALASLASLVIVGVAERDLQGRPEEQIRGNRFAWRLASLNAVGALGLSALRAPLTRHTPPSTT